MTFGPVGVWNAFTVGPREVHFPIDVIHADPKIIIVFVHLYCQEC